MLFRNHGATTTQAATSGLLDQYPSLSSRRVCKSRPSGARTWLALATHCGDRRHTIRDLSRISRFTE